MRKSAAPSELGFNARDRQRLTLALKSTNEARLFRRLQAVLLVAEGRRVTEVAHITGLGQSSIYYLRDQYLHAHSAASLQESPRAGRPLVAGAITAQRILKELARSPFALGYRTQVWTVELLAKHLSTRYKCSISARTLRRRMRALGLRCKRPRYVYSEKEAHRAQKKGRLSGN
jgi:transposase